MTPFPSITRSALTSPSLEKPSLVGLLAPRGPHPAAGRYLIAYGVEKPPNFQSLCSPVGEVLTHPTPQHKSHFGDLGWPVSTLVAVLAGGGFQKLGAQRFDDASFALASEGGAKELGEPVTRPTGRGGQGELERMAILGRGSTSIRC